MRRAHLNGVHVAAVVLLGVAACSFEPVFQDGTISCRDERDCPPSYVCVNPGVCYARTHTVDGAVLDAFARPSDAAADLASSTPDVAGAGGVSGAGSAAGSGGTIVVDGGAGQGGAGALDGGAGDSACGQSCTLGAKRCGTTGLETCIMIGTCPAFGADVACPGRETCQGVAPAAACACPTAPAGCTGAGSVCLSGNAVTCDVDEQACIYQKSVDTCATGKPCGGTFPAAACTCPTPPAVCGGKGGTYCSGTAAVVTCALDANGCLAMTQTTPCGATTPCSVTNNVATCSCAAPPAECAAGAGGVCRANGQLATCAIDGQGCLSVTNAAACTTGLTCQGTAPAGACKCPAPPAACNGGTGKYCQGSGTVVTCALDGNNCLVITSNATCPGAQTCGGSAGVAACACPALPAACPGGAGKLCNVSGQLVTCVADANGCVSVSATTTCASSGLVCGGAFPSAACTCPAAPAGCQGTTGTFCSGTSTFVCSRDGNGCLVAGPLVSCASDLVCGGAAGAASCVCPAAPSACMGATTGNVCQSGTSYVTCGPTAHGCVQVTSAAGTCPGGSKTCTGSAGAAACACNTSPSASCTAGGVFQSGNACSGTQLVKCSVDGNGCDVSAPGPCGSPMTCSGAAGSAMCGCPAPYNPSACSGGLNDGNHCVGTTLYTCSNAGSECQQLATTGCASNQLCVGSYPSARCASEQQLGTPGAAGGQETWSNLLIGVKVNVPVTSTLRRFGIAWNGNGAGAAQSRLATFALYKDGGSGPSGSLLASAIDRTVNAIGPLEFNLTSPAGGLTVAAGDYWVFVNLNGAGYVARNPSPSTPYLYVSETYGGALPATVTPASFMSGALAGPLGFWLVVIPQQ
ncbi:MAG TPA: hypothetical protein VH560_19215 [Polyangia bacterium]|nr:hypothetical protein [Polyangia bacterium]